MAIIEHEDNEHKGRFFVKDGNAYLAQMTYSRAGAEKIIISHTEVDDRLKGQGTGKKMLDAIVAWARVQQLQIIPLCPFAKAMMEKNMDEYKDVLTGYKQ